jgi:hypothetical protein
MILLVAGSRGAQRGNLSAKKQMSSWRRGDGKWLVKRSSLPIIAVYALMLGFTGCSATTPVVSEWRNPGYSSASFKRIMVGGLGGATSVRRNFEDEFVTQLRAVGIDALPSYRYMPETEQIDEANLKQAAQKSGADAAIIARSIQVEEKRQLSPSYFPAPWFGFYGSHVGASWSGLYGAPSVYRYNEYTSETTLYDVAKNEVVWSGTITTTDPSDVKTAIKKYVEVVMRALREKNLLGAHE